MNPLVDFEPSLTDSEVENFDSVASCSALVADSAGWKVHPSG